MSGAAAYAQVAQTSLDQVVREHAPLVKRLAYHLKHRLPQTVAMDDLMQAGMMGLLEAARQYDETQGASFTTYASIRIRGAMLDEVRRNDWAPRSVHRRVREVTEVVRALEHQAGRAVRDEEVAAAMGIGLEEYHRILQDASTTRLFRIDTDPEEGAGIEPVSGTPAPLEELEQAGFQAALAQAIQQLPEREQLVMALYYDEELNLREIGEVLGVTESRICQIHGRILVRLRTLMAEWTATAE